MSKPGSAPFALLRALIKLARYREYVLFVFLTSLVGVKLADAPLDWRMPIVLLTNMLTVCFAFMVNDIEDAELDALHPWKRLRNPISSGELARPWAYAVASAVAALTLLLSALIDIRVFLLSLAGLALGWAYSWQALRLKAMPIIDLISHTLMLAGIQLLVAYFSYASGSWSIWPVFMACILVSAYGELYNELHDFETDRAVGLRTTAIVLGQPTAQVLMYAFLAGSCMLVVLSIWQRLVPLQVVAIPVVVLLAIALYRPSRDARGQVSLDFSGSLQVPALVAINATMTVWVISDYVRGLVVHVSSWLSHF
jgi:4-hydroxybenzoate polyprenyltransferase